MTPTELDWDDQTDLTNATRGLIDRLEPCVIRNAAGRVVWDNDRWDFLRTGECPPTVHPSLWRMGRLNREQGLFEVCPGVYQVRGLDCSNLTVVEGDTGVVLIDPLLSSEVAAEAIALYRRNRGDRPVRGVVYSHSHGDHFGGVRAVTTESDVDAGRCQIVAPAGFMEHAVSENIIAGPAMRIRGAYQYGALLPPGPEGGVGGGLAQSWSSGTLGVIPPTVDITATGQELTIDGVRMVFQLTPETEAPAEMNLYLPDHRVLLVAENASHTLHNVLTLRGALVRDAHAWAGYLTETIQLFGLDADILIGSHHWPTWGRAELVALLSQQRDAYADLHDQTVRLMNRGLTGLEIAEEITEFPGELGRAWHARGYYGSISHNVKAVYQRYMGWYDGNPAHLWQLPPAAAGQRYVKAMGGCDAVVAAARDAYKEGDYRWVAELLNHVVFAQPDHAEARELQARTFEQIAYAQENATWRNAYLTGAQELREVGAFRPDRRGRDGGVSMFNVGMLGGLSHRQLFDLLAVRLDGPRAAPHRLVLRWELDRPAETWTTLVANGVLTAVPGPTIAGEGPHVTVRLPRAALDAVAAADATFATLVADATIELDGDASCLDTLAGLLDHSVVRFPIAMP